MKVDHSNMRQIIIDSPKQLEDGLALAKDIKLQGIFKNAVVCGMGGSALPADIARALGISLYVHKDYNLPPTADQNSLIICISYSGNTEETISALKEAIEKKLTVVCMASGGQIEVLAKKHNLPLVKIPVGIQPRCATGYFFSALLTILAKADLAKDFSQDIQETSKKLQDLKDSLEKEGKTLAKKLAKKIPIVYASGFMKTLSIARIWKIKFNENSKIPAFYNYFPELNHNEMVGYAGLKKLDIKNLHTIILQDSSDHPRNVKRMALTANLIKKSGAKVEIINIKEGSPLFKIFSSLLLGDWVSYYLALQYKVDPTPVAMVEEFKKMMQE